MFALGRGRATGDGRQSPGLAPLLCGVAGGNPAFDADQEDIITAIPDGKHVSRN
jgi:hypothetical protein